MGRWVRCSYALSAAALAVFTVLVCSNDSGESWPALAPLRVMAVASSAVALLVGLVVFAVLDWRGRTGKALVVGGGAAVAGLPALAVLFRLLFPTD